MTEQPVALVSHIYLHGLSARKLEMSNNRYGLRWGVFSLHVTREQWDQMHVDGLAAFDAADAHQSLLDGMLPTADVSGIAYTGTDA